MPRYSGLVPLLVGGFLFACQGDQGPSGPGRDLDIAAAGVCKSVDFTSYTEAMYTSASLERARLQQCKTAEAAFAKNKLAAAEAAVNAILVAIYNDYIADPTRLVALTGETLEESVIEYMTVSCLLAGLSPGSECLIPDAPSDLTDGSWVAVGPLATGGVGELPNDLFGFRVDGGNGVYVFVSSRPISTAFLGGCPGNSDNDCQEDIFDVDADGTFSGITVESCEIFETGRLRHMHCPEGGECEFGVQSPAPGLITCEEQLEGVAGFLYDLTRPVQWVIHATPAYAAGTGTKFTAFSPVVLGDMDPRARGVVCSFQSQYNNGSAGTICELFEQGTTTLAECGPFDADGNGFPCSCTSVANEGAATGSSCQLQPKVPAEITYDVKARKTGANGGAYTAMGVVVLAPDAPQRGDSNQVCFQMDPPSAFWVESCAGFPVLGS